jgi:hypothetical protein
MSKPSAVREFLFARMIPVPASLGFLLALALSIAPSFDAAAQTAAPASGTQDGTTGTVTTPTSEVKEKRFPPGTIAKTIIQEASRLTNDAVAWARKLNELELELRNGAPQVEAVRRHVDECIVVLQAVAERLAPKSETRSSLQRQEDAIRDLANRAEVRAEQSIRKITGYFQQKTTEFHALNRSMEETRIQLIVQIDQLQELKEELNFNHAAAQNGDPLNGAKTTLAHLQALTADAQRVANDLDSFGANPSVTGKPADVGASVGAAKRR